MTNPTNWATLTYDPKETDSTVNGVRELGRASLTFNRTAFSSSAVSGSSWGSLEKTLS